MRQRFRAARRVFMVTVGLALACAVGSAAAAERRHHRRHRFVAANAVVAPPPYGSRYDQSAYASGYAFGLLDSGISGTSTAFSPYVGPGRRAYAPRGAYGLYRADGRAGDGPEFAYPGY